MSTFETLFTSATPHGIISGVSLPDSPDPVPDDILGRLCDSERAHAADLGGYRQVQFVGGRIAIHAAMASLGVTQVPVLPSDRGAPVLPRGLTGSISHKRTIAVAMVARSSMGTLGVDIETYGPARPRIEERVLTAEEQRDIASLDGERRWIAVLTRFSLKEAIYKALDPHVRRYVGFHEVRVSPMIDGDASVELDLAKGEGPFRIVARVDWMRGFLLTSARIRKA